MPLTAEHISIIVFYAIIALLIIIYRKKFDIQNKVLFLLRTKRGLKLIDRMAQFKRFWTFWGYVGVPVGFAGLVFSLYMLIFNVISILKTPDAAAGVSLVIPGVHIPGVSIYLPFWYGILSLAVVLFVHEFSHGVVARAHGMKIKSAGVGMLGPLPLAFVEPDEKQLMKSQLRKKLSVFAAGPFANICVAILVSLVASFMLIPIASAITSPAGISIIDVESGKPAELAGIMPGSTITSFNNQTITTVYDFENKMLSTSPGESILLETSSGLVEVVTTSNPNNSTRAHVGISFNQKINIKESVSSKFGSKLPWSVFYLIQFSYWLYLLNLGIGLINLLPLGPLDGGRMINAVLKKYIKETPAKRIFSLISIVSLLVLILNLFLPVALKAAI